MADRPIIFSAPMIRALLDGRKTQTRRVAKITAVMGNKVAVDHPDERLIELEPGEFRHGVCHYESTGALSGPYPLPAAVGDRLYVREAWAPLDACTHNDPGAQALADRGFYRADHPVDCGDVSRWRPSIHMPRWASRLTLIVTDVRVQRLQDISEVDAKAEGAAPKLPDQPKVIPGMDGHLGDFRDLWNSLHGPDAWDANPWVCALTFTVHRGNIDQIGGAA
jgi:hypothetical protein